MYKGYDYHTFSEIDGYFNCLQAISLLRLSEVLKSCQTLKQIITYVRDDRF